jgi:hypothetical protein
MRTSLAVAIAIPLLLLMEMDGAAAQNYAWCAEAIKGGGRNCGFVSWEQCMATVSGNGGYCEQNSMYRPELERAVPSGKRRR